MKNYLNDQIQRVFVNNTISDSCKVLTVGVLQGFIVFNKRQCNVYADVNVYSNIKILIF